MVEEPEAMADEPIPPPPPRPARLPPRVETETADSLASSQWELPSIPTGSLDLSSSGTGDLSWSEDSASYLDTTKSAPAKPTIAPGTPKPANFNLSAEQLDLVWGRVGVQICEVAAELHEKSKKALIGDGTYIGFINAVLSRVPNASPIDDSTNLGYLIYAQSGASVQKRTAEIMPGDIIMLQDAKLKGHKGLQSYHQSVGEGGEPLFGIVGEFEGKKNKARVFQANQHVGQQTVESVSYRLEDLKAGNIKVFRVLES